MSVFKRQRDAALPALDRQAQAALPALTQRYTFTGDKDAEGRNHGWGTCAIFVGSRVSAQYQGMFENGV